MTGQQAVQCIDRLLIQQKQRHLNDLESIIVLQTWAGNTYRQIADQLSYELDYIKQVAARLWKTLSKLINENVSKINIKSVLERCQELAPQTDELVEVIPVPIPPVKVSADDNPHRDYQEIRSQTSETWMISDRCHAIAFFNSQKTTNLLPSSQHHHQQLQQQLESLVWQNLQKPLPPELLIDQLLSMLTVSNMLENPINCLVINYYL
jgi:hypothetical protein